MNAIRLIVNADDFGLHTDINQGIVRAFEGGIVRSTSIVACGAAFNEAIQFAKGHSELGVGVHLTLVEERPVLPRHRVPSLLGEEGRFYPGYRSVFRNFPGIRHDEIRAEWTAQIERVFDAGIVPTHLDSHQHVHAFPSFSGIVLDLLRRFKIRYVRSHLIPLRDTLVSGVGGMSLALLGRIAQARYHWNTVQTYDQLLGISRSGHIDLNWLRKELSRLTPGTYELMCHPGMETASLHQRYKWHFCWGKELESLTDSSILDLVRDKQITLISYGGLK
jgi:chitin disaccharide deacetylase